MTPELDERTLDAALNELVEAYKDSKETFPQDTEVRAGIVISHRLIRRLKQ